MPRGAARVAPGGLQAGAAHRHGGGARRAHRPGDPPAPGLGAPLVQLPSSLAIDMGPSFTDADLPSTVAKRRCSSMMKLLQIIQGKV